jgi:hypothetical protein
MGGSRLKLLAARLSGKERRGRRWGVRDFTKAAGLSEHVVPASKKQQIG